MTSSSSLTSLTKANLTKFDRFTMIMRVSLCGIKLVKNRIKFHHQIDNVLSSITDDREDEQVVMRMRMMS